MTNPGATPPSSGLPQIRVCAKCRHMKSRAKVVLFDGQDLQSAGALKAQTQWDQDAKQRAQLELQRYQSRQAFDYEPHNYAWCAKYTRLETVQRAQQGDQAAIDELMRDGGATMNPVTGEIGPLYHLCAWHNEKGDCEAYEPK